MTAVADIRIVEAGTIKRNEVMTQVIPELVYKAAKCISNCDLVVEKYPEHAFELNQILDLRLRIMKEQYLCDEIHNRINRIKRDTAKTVIVWAKDKSFGPMLDKDGVVDMKKVRVLFQSKGKDYVIKAIEDYNQQLVPFANKTSGPKGDWSKEEKAQHLALQDLQRELNALVTKMHAFIK